MKNTFKATMNLLKSLKRSTDMKTKRNFDDFFSDRIIQSVSEPSLLDAIEHLSKSINVNMQYINMGVFAEFMKHCQGDCSYSVLCWLRKHPKVVSMITSLKDEEEYNQILESIEIDEVSENNMHINVQPEFDVEIKIELLSPLAHGSDHKAGNATLFRRRQVLSKNGDIKELPYYSGNALRGKMRDLLADDFLKLLALDFRRDAPSVNLWFFHTLYAGGVLEEQGKSTDQINYELGKAGSIKAEGVRKFRDTIPIISLLGAAIGNRILQGRLHVNDLRPCCREWGTGELPVNQIMEWTFLTRRDDFEGRSIEDDHHGMIANTEVIKTGTCLVGGIDTSNHIRDIELSALGRGLQLLKQEGNLGAENRRGLGKCLFEFKNQPDQEPYLNWIKENREKIIGYMVGINATPDGVQLNASS